MISDCMPLPFAWCKPWASIASRDCDWRVVALRRVDVGKPRSDDPLQDVTVPQAKAGNPDWKAARARKTAHPIGARQRR
jgi:hypothetical protein